MIMPLDSETLRAILRAEPLENIEDAVTSHIDEAEDVELDAIIVAVKRSRKVDTVANVISALSFRRIKNIPLQEITKSLAQGEDWDNQERVRLEAIFALHRLCPPDDDVRAILKKAYQSPNIVVRDAALVAAQSYCDVPPQEIKWGDGESDLAERVDARVLEWIGSAAQG